MARKLKGEAGLLSVLGKVANMAQEVMGSTVSISKEPGRTGLGRSIWMTPKRVSPWTGDGEGRVFFLMREESGTSEGGI